MRTKPAPVVDPKFWEAIKSVVSAGFPGGCTVDLAGSAAAARFMPASFRSALVID